jgi:hypothetical protein
MSNRLTKIIYTIVGIIIIFAVIGYISPKMKTDKPQPKELGWIDLMRAFPDSVYNISGIKFKIGAIIEIDAKDTNRWGLNDLQVSYIVPRTRLMKWEVDYGMTSGSDFDKIILPKSKATIEEIIKTIVDKELAKTKKEKSNVGARRVVPKK